MDLESLRKSISDMSDEELLDTLSFIRTNRRTNIKTLVGTDKRKPVSKEVKAMLEKMSPEELSSLMELFQ